MKIEKYSLPLIGNMDETPFFWYGPRKITSSKKWKVRQFELLILQRHMAVVLTVAADEFISPRMMILRGKFDETIKEIIALTG